MITADEIQVIVKSNQKIQENVKALVMTYDLGAKMTEQIKSFGKFQMAIADEAYYLKNSDAKRTEQIVPILQACKRVILLAGTPALARPKEIFNLLHILRPDILKDFKEFGKRYCAPSFNKFARGLDYTGASNLKELHYILTNSLMIRRLKKDVLSQLPDKVRQKIQVETSSDHIELIKEALKKNKFGGPGGDMEKMSQILEKLVRPNCENFEEEANKIESEQELKFPQFFECYKYTGLAKLEGIKKYLKEVLQQQESKFLVFAHHAEILDALEQEVAAMGIKYIRIDGGVQTRKRFELVKSFQEDQQVKVGILSLTAAGIGLTLTEASKVIFAEMYWTPAIMLQAEDRIHRIGQKEKTSVNYYYLYGEDTLDALLYKILQKKIAVVSEMLEGEANKLRLDTEKDLEISNTQPSKRLVVKKKTESEKKRIEELEVYEYNPFERRKSSSEERSEQGLEFGKKLTDIRDKFEIEKLNSMGDSQATVKKEKVSKGPEELIRKLTKNKNRKEELIQENSRNEDFMELLTQTSQSNNSRKYQRNFEENGEQDRKSKNEKKQERKQIQKTIQLEFNHSNQVKNFPSQEHMQIGGRKPNHLFNRNSQSQPKSDSIDWDNVESLLSRENTKNIFEMNHEPRDAENTVGHHSDSNGSEVELIDKMLSAQKQQPLDEFSKRLLEKCTNQKAVEVIPQMKINMETIKSNLENFHYSKTQNKNDNARGYVRLVTQTQSSERPPSPKKDFMSQISLDYYNFKKNLKPGGNSQDYQKIRSQSKKVYSRKSSKVMEEEEEGEFQPQSSIFVVKNFQDIIKEKKFGQIEEEQRPTVSSIKLNSKKITPYINRSNTIPKEVKGMRNYMRTISDEYDDPLGFNDFKEITNEKEIARSQVIDPEESCLLTKRKLPSINEKDEDPFYDLLKKMK